MSANSLFRTEALAGNGESQPGESRLAPTAGLHTTAAIILGIILLTVALLSGTTYTRKVPVTGSIDAGGARQILAADHGELTVVAVAENQPVAKNQFLGEIHRHTDTRSIENSLADRQQHLEALRVAAITNRQAASHRLDTNINHAGKSLTLATRELKLQQQQLKDRQYRLKRVSTLRDSGHVSELEWSAYRGAVIEAWQQLHRQRGEVETLKFKLLDLQAERKRQVAASERELAELDIRIAGVLQEQAVQGAAQRQRLRSPIDGRVTRIPLPAGSHVTPGTAVFHISARQDALSGTLFIPSHAAGFIEPGQELQLEVDAFPVERHGTLTATILHVPDHPVAMGANEGAFLARISIRAADLKRKDHGQYLPGMRFRTFLSSGQKTIAQWLLDPLAQRVNAL